MVIFFPPQLLGDRHPAITVPLSPLARFGLYELGYSLDNLSLMALIAIGFVVTMWL